MAKRRGNGEGNLRQRPNGSWEGSVMLGYKSTGARNIKYFSGSTKTEVRKKMQAYLDARERGMDVDTDYTLSEWIDVYMELHSPNIKPVTVENYKYTTRLITRHLGDKSIRKIRPMDIEKLLLTLRDEGRSDSAISQARGLLYSVMQKAVGNNLIINNPVQFVPKLRKRPPAEKEVYSEADFKLLMRELPDTKIGHSIRILLCYGLRSQELLALTPNHIEPDGSRLHIKQAVSMVRGSVSISSPKSFDSIRSVVVPSIATESALYLRDTCDHYVWQSPTDDKPINPSTFRKLYRECLESIPGVPYLPPHNCRHSYVSMLLAQGADLPTIQSLVGHSTQLMTIHYTHIYPNVQAEAAERLSHMFD